MTKIGQEKVEWLENTKNELKKRKEWELIEMIQRYRTIVLEDMIHSKSNKVQKEIMQYVKNKWKKKREILYDKLNL